MSLLSRNMADSIDDGTVVRMDKLIVSNMPRGMDMVALRALFDKYGLKTVRWRPGKGYALLRFADKSGATTAKQKLGMICLGGRYLRIKYARW
jgi:RNA recognition motif. (a.k.a. RRM, RBD, or RNP domain)